MLAAPVGERGYMNPFRSATSTVYLFGTKRFNQTVGIGVVDNRVEAVVVPCEHKVAR